MINVIAVKKGSNEIAKPIYLSDNVKTWSVGKVSVPVDGKTDTPSSMVLPSKGMGFKCLHR